MAMKIRIFLALALAVLALGGLVAVYSVRNCQNEIAFSDPASPVASYPVSHSVVEVCPGVYMQFNPGSSVSMLNPADVALLRAAGVRVDSTFFPAFGTDSRDNVIFTKKRYVVRLPAPTVRASLLHSLCRRMAPDSTASYIDNVTFLPGRADRPSVIGADIMERFVVEYRPAAHIVTLRNAVPQDYIPVAKMQTHSTLATTLGAGRRYYLNVTIDGNEREYMLHSGLDRVRVKMPLADTIYVHTPRWASTFSDGSKTVNTQAGRAWMQVGVRAGERLVTFSDYRDNDEDYLLNPGTFFEQPLVFDFPNRTLYMRPHSYLPRVSRRSMAQELSR